MFKKERRLWRSCLNSRHCQRIVDGGIFHSVTLGTRTPLDLLSLTSFRKYALRLEILYDFFSLLIFVRMDLVDFLFRVLIFSLNGLLNLRGFLIRVVEFVHVLQMLNHSESIGFRKSTEGVAYFTFKKIMHQCAIDGNVFTIF